MMKVCSTLFLTLSNSFGLLKTNLYPCLAASTQERFVEHCIGKYLRGSGVEDALVETGVFSVKVEESTMNGSHYIKSVRRKSILADALNTLKWEAFWKTNNGADFGDILSAADQLKIAFKEKDSSRVLRGKW